MLKVRALAGVNLPPAPKRCKCLDRQPRFQDRPQGGLAMADSRAHPEQTSPFTDKPGAADGSMSRSPNDRRKCIKRLAHVTGWSIRHSHAIQPCAVQPQGFPQGGCKAVGLSIGGSSK